MVAKVDGNLKTVRDAISGITGVNVEQQPEPQRYYMIVCRPNHEYDTVDSFRRQGQPAFWPSYEDLVTTRKMVNGQPMRRIRRVGIVAGYVFTPALGDRDFTNFLQRIVGAIEIARSMSGKPIFLSEADIAIFRRIEADPDDKAKKAEAAKRAFQVGEKVRFKDDLQHRWPPGKIIKVARGGRIAVEVAMMGRKIEIKALPHQIERT